MSPIGPIAMMLIRRGQWLIVPRRRYSALNPTVPIVTLRANKLGTLRNSVSYYIPLATSLRHAV